MSAPLPLDPEERRELRAAERQARQRSSAIEIVDDLPKIKTGYTARNIPETRQKLIDACIANPGKWVRYTPTPEQDKAKAHSFSTMTSKQQGGFPAGFKVSVREKVAYFRYIGGDNQ